MRVARPLVIAAVVAMSGCSHDAPVESIVINDRVTYRYTPPDARGLVVEVSLAPNGPVRRGDTLTVTSSIRNQGTRTLPVESRTCELGLAGSIALRDPFVHCAAFSVSGTMAPGVVRTMSDRRIVMSGPGQYVLTVSHLLNPAGSIRVPVVVVE